MSIFDFLKKITKRNDAKKIVMEKLTFSEIKSWIEKKTEENELKEKEILFETNKKVEDFARELRDKIINLKGFNIEARKEKEKIKNIVNDSKEKYIESVEDLIKKVDNLEEPKLKEYIEKIDKIFFDFNKSSFKNYERARILIGKEITGIKESLKVFSRDITKIFEESKPVMDLFGNLGVIKKRLNAIAPAEKTLEEIIEKKLNLNKQISEKEKEDEILKQNLKEIKDSSAYLENLAKQKKIEFLKEELKKEILELKQLFDFKSLAGFFHINPEQIKIVKEYKENFYANFIKDNGKFIISLLDEANLKNEEIIKKMEKVHSKMEEIKNHEQEIKKDETWELHSKIKEIESEIDNLKTERDRDEKRHEKLKTSKEELISILKKELGKMNVEVI